MWFLVNYFYFFSINLAGLSSVYDNPYGAQILNNVLRMNAFGGPYGRNSVGFGNSPGGNYYGRK